VLGLNGACEMVETVAVLVRVPHILFSLFFFVILATPHIISLLISCFPSLIVCSSLFFIQGTLQLDEFEGWVTKGFHMNLKQLEAFAGKVRLSSWGGEVGAVVGFDVVVLVFLTLEHPCFWHIILRSFCRGQRKQCWWIFYCR
jgi:hypothetical protein